MVRVASDRLIRTCLSFASGVASIKNSSKLSPICQGTERGELYRHDSGRRWAKIKGTLCDATDHKTHTAQLLHRLLLNHTLACAARASFLLRPCDLLSWATLVLPARELRPRAAPLRPVDTHALGCKGRRGSGSLNLLKQP